MLSKEIDNQKLIYHPESVAHWMKRGDCFPVYVEIGLTDSCNHRCIYCALDWLNKDGLKIEKDIMLRALKDMASNGVKSVMFAGEGDRCSMGTYQVLSGTLRITGWRLQLQQTVFYSTG